MAEAGAEAAPGQDPEPGAAADPPTPADRRSFLRQLSTDAVWTAGKLAGASAVLRRSLVAAGESAIETLEVATAGEGGTVSPVPEAADRGHGPDTPPVQPASSSVAERPAPPLNAAPDPVTFLTPEQQAFLGRSARATLAVNDPGGHPLLASTAYHWDGALIRIPGRDFTARSVNIARDPRVGLLIEDPATGAWVAINGTASLVYGDDVEPEMRLILAKHHDPDGVQRQWDQQRATGDQVVIRIRPTRFVWRSA